MGFENAVVSLTICDDKRIRELNLIHRSLDRATDVLSFPQELMKDGGFTCVSPSVNSWLNSPADRLLELGDVVISSETAARQASRFGEKIDDEMTRLLIHGILHLLGWDHTNTNERRRMRYLEKRLHNAAIH